MDECIRLLHSIEFVTEKCGEITYRCVSCDKTYIQYNDATCGR